MMFKELAELERNTFMNQRWPRRVPTNQEYETKFTAWKKDYYEKRIGINYNLVQMKKIVGSYVEGLQWVMRYYFNGVASWEWYYPYRCSPRVSGERIFFFFLKSKKFA